MDSEISESKSFDSNSNTNTDNGTSSNSTNGKNNSNKRNFRRNNNNSDKKFDNKKGKQNSNDDSSNDNNQKSNNKNGRYRNNRNKYNNSSNNSNNDEKQNIINPISKTNNNEGGNKPRNLNNNKNKKKFNKTEIRDGESLANDINTGNSSSKSNRSYSSNNRYRNKKNRQNSNKSTDDNNSNTEEGSSSNTIDEKSSNNYKRNILKRKPENFGKLTSVESGESSKESSKTDLEEHNHANNHGSRPHHRTNKAHNQRLTNLEKVEIMTKKVTNASDQDLQFSLTVELTNSTYECMVCYNIVKPKDHIWSCSICYNVFHLNCIKKWAKTDVSTAGKDGGWRCPGCQSAISEVPSKYTCFCGKIENPRFNPYITPHSCTNICGRPRDCSHPCREQCHPGPCPPCNLFAPEETCYCGKKKYTYRCSDLQKNRQVIMEQKTCGEICGKKLNCGKHTCTKLCHPGPCDECKERSTETCYCGRESRDFDCGKEHKYSCHTPCNYIYPCQVHHCERKCHPLSEHGTCCPYDPSVNIIITNRIDIIFIKFIK